MSVKKYCYCENNCRYETLSKEEILAAIAQAVATGKIGECDTGFITTIKTINGQPLKFFVGDQNEYTDLSEEQKENLFAIITNDTTKEGITKALGELQTNYKELSEGLNNGNVVVAKAKNASSATSATKDGNGNVIPDTYATKEALTDGTLVPAKAKILNANVRNGYMLGTGTTTATFDFGESPLAAGIYILTIRDKSNDFPAFLDFDTTTNYWSFVLQVHDIPSTEYCTKSYVSTNNGVSAYYERIIPNEAIISDISASAKLYVYGTNAWNKPYFILTRIA